MSASNILQCGSALIAACLYQRKENGLELLVERGVDVNMNCGGEFPYAIIAMAYTGDVDGLQFLIDKGADVNKFGGKWHSAIQASTSDDAIGEIVLSFHRCLGLSLLRLVLTLSQYHLFGGNPIAIKRY